MATSTGYWENDAGNVSTYSLQSKRSPNRYHLMRILRKAGMRQHGEILSTLLEDVTAGQVPQSSASITKSQIDAVATTGGNNSQGGVRGVTSNEQMSSVINNDQDSATANTARAVSAADVTELQTELLPSGSRNSRAPTYPTDASGNGGGGKMDAGR
jgi:hypothetical protein|tara:strand:+ start:200 stop:670 length:471 start_codon:yes stop_codon:yes gene_type:complete